MGELGILFRLARRRWRSYAFSVFVLFCGTSLFLLIPSLLGELIQSLGEGEEISLARLSGPATSIAAVLIVQAFLMAIYTYVISLAAEQIGNEIRASFFNRLIGRPLMESAGQKMGAIASEFVSDLAILQAGLSDNLISFLRHTVFTTGAILAMFLVDWRMAGISIISVLCVAGILAVLIKLATGAMVRSQEHRAKTVSLLIESASNAYVIKAYDRLGFFDGIFGQRLSAMYTEIARNLKFLAIINPVSMIVFAIAIFVILASGIEGIAQGRMEIADLVAFITYAFVLVASVSQLGLTYGKLKQAGVMYTKHRSLLTAPDYQTDSFSKGRPREAAKSAPEIRVENVSFSYPGSQNRALENVSILFASGKVTAVVGESGAGKSTLAAMLAGLIDPQGGTISFDTLTGAGTRCAIVPQNPFIFAGTIAENIRFGREWISDSQIVAAAKTAQIDRHIRTLPGQYEFYVEEAGQNFSRGQLQRLSLARAIADQPKALILDEATASLDIVSERAITNSLQALAEDVTIIIIAHHGELLSISDNLVILDGGRVSYQGKPEFAPRSEMIATHLFAGKEKAPEDTVC